MNAREIFAEKVKEYPRYLTRAKKIPFVTEQPTDTDSSYFSATMPLLENSTNITYTPEVNNSANKIPIYQASTESIIIGFVGPSLIIVSSMSCFVILNTYLKKLHKSMKNFLITLSLHNFTCSLISIAQTLYIFFSENQNFLTCSILCQSWIPVILCSFIHEISHFFKNC